jgi:hypothetical protein
MVDELNVRFYKAEAALAAAEAHTQGRTGMTDMTARCVEAATRDAMRNYYGVEGAHEWAHPAVQQVWRAVTIAALHAFISLQQQLLDTPQGFGEGEVNTEKGIVLRELRQMMEVDRD